MFAIVTIGLFVGMFALFAIGAIAFLDVAMRPAPGETGAELVSYTWGQEAESATLTEMPKSHVA